MIINPIKIMFMNKLILVNFNLNNYDFFNNYSNLNPKTF